MMEAIEFDKVKNKPIVEIPTPVLMRDVNDNPMRNSRGRLLFNVKNTKIDFGLSKLSPIMEAFIDDYIIGGGVKISKSHLSVFFYLAKTTQWSTASVLVDGKGEPIMKTKSTGSACITRHGNRTSTKSLLEISDGAGCSYGTVQKCLDKWENLGVITKIDPIITHAMVPRFSSGRHPEYRRYEFDPRYVWRGDLFLSVGYQALTYSVKDGMSQSHS